MQVASLSRSVWKKEVERFAQKKDTKNSGKQSEDEPVEVFVKGSSQNMKVSDLCSATASGTGGSLTARTRIKEPQIPLKTTDTWSNILGKCTGERRVI